MDLYKIRFDLTLAGAFEIFEKLVGYFVLATLARHLDKSTMGEFFFAVTYASIFAMLTQLGTKKYLVRRISEDPRHALTHLGEVLSVRVPLVVATFLVMNAIAWVLMPDQIFIVMLTGFYLFTMNLYLSFAVFFSGLRLMSYRVATKSIGRILLVILILGSIQLGWGLEGILLCYIIANASLLILTVFIVLSRFGWVHLKWDSTLWQRVVTPSILFFFLTFLDLLVFKVDTVMLQIFASTQAVADYEAAYKFFEVSRVVVRPTSMVFFPICVQMVVQGNWFGFTAILRKLLLSIGLIGIGLSCVVILLAPILIPAVWGGQYGESIPILQVLFLAVPPLYLSSTGIFLANSLYLERTLIRVLVASLIGNIALNSLAIPQWGAIGAAWTTVVTEVVFALCVIGVILARVRQQQDPHVTRPIAQEMTNRAEAAVQYEDA